MIRPRPREARPPGDETSSAQLPARILAAITGDGPPWFPSIGPDLASDRWSSLQASTELDADAYGTLRVLEADAAADRTVAAELALPARFGTRRPVLIESLSGRWARQYEKLGLAFAPESRASDDRTIESLRAALGRLEPAAGLARVIGAVLATVHVLEPEGADFDVSYSDPRLPFSIFVGVHASACERSELRIAESLLHECMHLLLTMIERHVPLIAGPGRYLSPWQNTMRPAGGVLHGAYVFACIRDFFLDPRVNARSSSKGLDHVRRRIEQSQEEIAFACRTLLAGEDLTEAGRLLAGRLLTPRPESMAQDR